MYLLKDIYRSIVCTLYGNDNFSEKKKERKKEEYVQGLKDYLENFKDFKDLLVF